MLIAVFLLESDAQVTEKALILYAFNNVCCYFALMTFIAVPYIHRNTPGLPVCQAAKKLSPSDKQTTVQMLGSR